MPKNYFKKIKVFKKIKYCILYLLFIFCSLVDNNSIKKIIISLLYMCDVKIIKKMNMGCRHSPAEFQHDQGDMQYLPLVGGRSRSR